MSSTSLSKKITIDRWRPIMLIYCTMTHHAPYPLWPRSTTHHPVATSRLVKTRTKTHSSIKNTKLWPTTHAHRTTIVDHRTIAATTYDHQTTTHDHWTTTHDPKSKPWSLDLWSMTIGLQTTKAHNRRTTTIDGPQSQNQSHWRTTIAEPQEREERSEKWERKEKDKWKRCRWGELKTIFFFYNPTTMSCFW